MTSTQDRVTRFSAELFEAAASEGRQESRSARQQLEHWARVGREVSSHASLARRRVEAALAGELRAEMLTPAEGVVLNAEIDAALEGRLGSVHVGAVLAAEGVTTVALDDQGRLVRHRPDGSTVVLDD